MLGILLCNTFAVNLSIISIISYVLLYTNSKDIVGKHAICRSFSTIHALFTSILSVLVVYGVYIPHSLYYFSIAYYLADSIIHIHKCQKTSVVSEAPMIIHHLIQLLYEGYAIIYNPADLLAFYYLNRILLSEISVIPLNAIWYYRTIDVNNKRALTISGVMLVITYFLSRIVNLTSLMIEARGTSMMSLSYFAILPLFFNYMWFYKIIKGFIQHIIH
jgi:hypothetical protein